MRVVIDPNVLISAAISPSGTPRELLTAWEDERYELVLSTALLDEVRDVLDRPRLQSRISPNDARDFVNGLTEDATLLADPPDPPSITADPDDDYLIALALAANADYLVSGDHHLLDLADPDPHVLTPRQLLDLLAKP